MSDQGDRDAQEKTTIPGLVQTFRGPKHHEPARPPCPQSSGTCRQGLAGSRGPRARREQPVVSLARSGAEAQTGQREIDPARVAESCSQRRHRGRCADAPSWRVIGKVRLGCDVGEGVGRSQSVIVVRDDMGVLEIFANQFESKAETAQAICGLAQKWQIGDWMGPPTLQDWMGPPTLRYQGLDGATHSPVSRIGWGHPLSGTEEMWMAPFVPRYRL